MTPTPDTKGAQPEQLGHEELEMIRLDAFRGRMVVSQYRALLEDRDALATALSECREALDATWEDVSMLLDLHTSEEVKDSSRRSLIERFSALYAAAQPPSEASDDAQFECGDWFSEVGAIRHPAITGVMCCPVHLKPYGENPERRPFPSEASERSGT